MKAGSPFGSPWTRYTEEFGSDVWTVLLACIVASILALVFVMRSSPHETVVWGFGEATITLSGLFASQGCSRVPVSASSRTLLLTFLMLSVLAEAHYSAFLYAKLSDLRFTIPFRSVSDILDDGSYTVGVWEGTSVHGELQAARDPLLQRLYQELLLPHGFFHSHEEALQRIEEEKFLPILNTLSVQQLTANTPCRYITLPIKVFSFKNGFAMRKGSPLKKIFHKAILNALETGVVDNYRQRWRLRHTNCDNVDGIPINLAQTMSAFFLLMAGVVAAAVVLIFECIKRRW